MKKRTFVDNWIYNNYSLVSKTAQRINIYNANKQMDLFEKLDEGPIYSERFVFESEENHFPDLWKMKKVLYAFVVALQWRCADRNIIKPFITYSFVKTGDTYQVILNMLGHEKIMSDPWIDKYLLNKLLEYMTFPVYYTRDPIFKPVDKINELIRGVIFYDIAKSSLMEEERNLGIIPKYHNIVACSKFASRGYVN